MYQISLERNISDGAKCFGMTNIQYLKKKNIENITILPRAMTIDAIKNYSFSYNSPSRRK